MSKAVLVLDMPDSCMGCNFLYCDAENNTESCQVRESARIVDLEKDDKPDWCPLKEMPEKRKPNALSLSPLLRETFSEYSKGWNDCIDAICEKEY